MVTIQEFREATRRGQHRSGGRAEELFPAPKPGKPVRSQRDVTCERGRSKHFCITASRASVFLVFEMSHFFSPFATDHLFVPLIHSSRHEILMARKRGSAQASK